MKTFSNVEIYGLPELTFIAGTYKELTFNVYTSGCSPINITPIQSYWSLSPYNNPEYISFGKYGSSYNGYLKIQVGSSDTKSLSGKFIQRVTLLGASGYSYRLSQGVVNIIPAIQTPEAEKWWLAGGISESDCIAVYKPKGSYSLLSSYINIANPGAYDATSPGNSPTWTKSAGWTFNGSNQYLKSNIVGSNNYSAIVKFANGAQTNDAIFGEHNSTLTRFNIYNYYTDNKAYFRAGGEYVTAVSTYYTSGILAVTPAKAYVNGTAIGSVASPRTGVTPYYIALGGQYVNGSMAEWWKGDIHAIAFYRKTLSDTEVAELTSRMGGF